MVVVVHSATTTLPLAGGEPKLLEGVTTIDEAYIKQQRDELLRNQILRMEVALREIVGELKSLKADVLSLKERVKDIEDRKKAQDSGIQVREPRRF